MRVLLSLVVLVVDCAALAAAQDAEREAAQKAWREENVKGARLSSAGRHPEALACLERALPLAEQGFGKESSQAAIALNNLAQLYLDLGQSVRAEPLFQRALAIQEKTLGPDHRLT